MQKLLSKYDSCTSQEMKRYIFQELQENKEKCIQHKHNYAITQLPNTGYWQTYVILDTGKRKLFRKKDKGVLYNDLFDFYFPGPVTTTIQELYPTWLSHKKKTTARITTIYRIDTDWIRFYLNDSISAKMISKDICELGKNEILEWMCHLIDTYNMTQKSYTNMSIIPRAIFTYAYDNDMLDSNNFDKVKIPTHLFVRTPKPDSTTQVFTQDEQIALCNVAMSEYYSLCQNIFSLHVPLIFLTGLRIGEVIALKWTDVKDDHLLIQNSLKRDLVRTEDGWLPATYSVHNSLKRNAPPRKIPLTNEASDILKEIKRHYEKAGEKPIYVFEKKGKIATEGALGKMWKNLCLKIGILPRSPHKGRKTFITTLIDFKLSPYDIGEISGHANKETTFKYYYFSRITQNELRNQMELALTCKNIN